MEDVKGKMSNRATILFIADAVTLAHLARPAALAQGLDTEKFDVVLACDSRYQSFLEHLPFPTLPVKSVSTEQFLRSAARGRPLYDTHTLHEYVRDDLALLESVQPAAVVGDHRLSLSVSARLVGVPYLGIINAYWSPYATSSFPLPELPMNRWMGLALARLLFRMAWPLASAYHAFPLNRVRRAYGLRSLGWDWCRAYTDADRTLYADAIELVPTRRLPSSHVYLGPILWSPTGNLPSWWDDLPTDRPMVYVTMGSSGRPELLELVLRSLADLPITIVATTAAKLQMSEPPANTRLLTYAPGEKLAARAEIVICNGGSMSVYQALSAGRPLIGIASNMDQHLSMSYVERAGVGTLLRSEELSGLKLRTAVHQMLRDRNVRIRAQNLARSISSYAPSQRLSQVLEEFTGRVED